MWDPLRRALDARADLLRRCADDDTDAVRLLHGAVEALPGTTVDRYGPVLLIQTWRDPLAPGDPEAAARVVEDALGVALVAVWNHRPDAPAFHRRHAPELPDHPECHELGLRFDARPRHRGNDPLLFLDLRALRRRLRDHAARSVLNAFAYTGGVGVAAAVSGATEVWNLDFAASALQVADENARRNGVADRVRSVRMDAIPALRMLAGQRPGRKRPPEVLDPRTFDLVVLDPPTRSVSAWGAVDLVRDYPTLLKPALQAVAPGGVLAATHHVADVSRDEFAHVLSRTAEKVGRRVEVDWIEPEQDFPSPDGRHPLKIAWVTAAG